jgi:hypothetical protein
VYFVRAKETAPTLGFPRDYDARRIEKAKKMAKILRKNGPPIGLEGLHLYEKMINLPQVLEKSIEDRPYLHKRQPQLFALVIWLDQIYLMFFGGKRHEFNKKEWIKRGLYHCGFNNCKKEYVGKLLTRTKIERKTFQASNSPHFYLPEKKQIELFCDTRSIFQDETPELFKKRI